MSLIIGITGLHQDTEKNRQTIGAGKDAAAARLIEKHGFVRIGIADHLKRICKDVFAFTDEQLWGPSDMRNKPDLRYPRGGKNGPGSMATYNRYKEELAKLEADGLKMIDAHDRMLHTRKIEEARRNVAEWETFAYLTPRYALQQLGTEWGRSCYDSVWIEDALRIAKRLLEADGCRYTEKKGLETSHGFNKPVGVVFSDVRFSNEYSSIKQAGGKLVRVKRFNWNPFNKTVDTSHQSETEMLAYSDDKFDYIIDNGGDLTHLGLLVDRMLDIFTGKIRPYDEAQADVPPALRT